MTSVQMFHTQRDEFISIFTVYYIYIYTSIHCLIKNALIGIRKYPIFTHLS